MPRTVVVAANSAWNIVTLRRGLIQGLSAAGYEPVAVAPIGPEVAQRVADLGVEHIGVDLGRSSLNPIADLKLLLAYRRTLRRISPGAFLGFTIKPNIYGCIAARSFGIPAMPNVSGLGTVFLMGGPLRSLVAAMYRFAFSRCPVVFFQNPDDLELFVGRRIVRRSQARLVPGSGIDLEDFAPVPLPPGPPVFLLIARLLRDKGVREYVEAARRLRAEYPDAQFQLLGPLDPGNRTAVPKDELDRWIEDGVIDYLGSAEDVRPHIAAATAIVLPSYREGLPRSLLEGGAMARPLIATDVPGCREVVEPGVNGFLCDVKSAASLEKAMRAFIRTTPEDRRELGAASRRIVAERFGEERVVQAYLDALETFARPS